MIYPLGDYENGSEQEFDFEVDEYKPRIVVKFIDRNPLDIPYNEHAHNYLMDRGGETWREVVQKFQLQTRPTFEPDLAKCLDRLAGIAQERARAKERHYMSPNYFTYFYLDTPVGVTTSAQYLQEAANQLRDVNFVEFAYVDRPAPDPFTEVELGPRFAHQGHMKPGEEGIGIQHVWDTLVGHGAGEGVNFIDLERGWAFDHEELVDLHVQNLYGNIRPNSRSHGTSVLGVVCAGLNRRGGAGIAPRVNKVNVVSHFGRERHNALAAALCQYKSANLGVGDVLLIEVQIKIAGPDGQDILAPVDVYPTDFALVELACHLGIIVVETGGNGSAADDDSSGGQIPPLDLDALNPPLLDSGAIIVSAAGSSVPHTRLPYAPFGSRIDCYAWGENISTCYYDASHRRDLYQPDPAGGRAAGFGGTSGAAAIVAGAMIVLQGIARARRQELDVWDWRPILRNGAFGTSHAAEVPAKEIRFMPDLRKIIDHWPF